ncbi:MAG: pilus assembly protein PilP [Burkholderiales bacterium]|nr:pilus assembly protein PilP [Burkholderiales bacterium]
MMRARTAIVLAAVLLGGCAGEKMQELQAWVKDQDNMPRPRIEPLPEVKPFEAFAYSADKDGLLDPFRPRKIEAPKQTAGSGIQPDLNRPREPLEAYPLENLRMVGTLAQKGQVFALIKTPDNNLFRVKKGNYLGQNFGLITEIDEGNVKLREIVQDGAGDWAERASTLQLQEEQEVAKK